MLNPYSGDLGSLTRADLEGFLALTAPDEQRPTEGTTLDFKLKLPDDVGVLVAAMANTYGGLIIVGVESDKHRRNIPTGLPGQVFTVSDIKAHVTNKILSTVRPRPVFDICVIPVRSVDRARPW